jgi:excisionase family DNA binding protein
MLLSPKELAETYNLPLTWVYNNIRTRQLPHFKLGHYVRFDEEEMAVWLEQQRRRPQREVLAISGDGVSAK